MMILLSLDGEMVSLDVSTSKEVSSGRWRMLIEDQSLQFMLMPTTSSQVGKTELSEFGPEAIENFLFNLMIKRKISFLFSQI